MSRMRVLAAALAVISLPAAAQQLQRPQPAPSPAAAPASTPAPTAVPATPAQRARQPAPVPSAGPARSVQPLAAPTPMPTPTDAVRDAQGRVIPGAREVVPGRAVDPATGETFRTEPSSRPE